MSCIFYKKGDTATLVKQDKDNYTFIDPFSNPRNTRKINSQNDLMGVLENDQKLRGATQKWFHALYFVIYCMALLH